MKRLILALLVFLPFAGKAQMPYEKLEDEPEMILFFN